MKLKSFSVEVVPDKIYQKIVKKLGTNAYYHNISPCGRITPALVDMETYTLYLQNKEAAELIKEMSDKLESVIELLIRD